MNDEITIAMPTLKEVKVLKALASRYDEDEMIDVAHWDGECWKENFNVLADYARENNMDEWDVFAVFVTKLLGTEFIFHDDGGVTVNTKGIAA